MLGCNTICPKCRHEFTCCVSTPACPQVPIAPLSVPCCPQRRSLHGLSGGGLIEKKSSAPEACAVQFHQQPQLSLAAQVSPSVPLAFILPFPALAATTCAPGPDAELRRLAETSRLLHESGWYHEGLSWQQSQALLKSTQPGTFLVRNSSDPRFLYSLSVQTDQGPTSVRLHYVDGKFRLDSETYLAPLMPMFDSVLDLISHYVRCSEATAAPRTSGQVWVDSKGCMFSRILLRSPLYRSDGPPKLQHLARLAVHKALEASARPRLRLLPAPHTQLELPASLTEYLAAYPYSL